MTSRHGGEAITSRRRDLVDSCGNILNWWVFLYFTLLETGLESTVSSVSKREALSVVC